MNRLFLIPFSLIIFPLQAQQDLRISIAPIYGNDAMWIDSYPARDSILLHYMVYSANIEIKKAVWVMPNGDSKTIDLDTEIFAVHRYGGDVYFYVLEEIKKKLVLKAIVDRTDNTRFEPAESITIEGDVLDEFSENNNHILLLHDRKRKKLVEMELNRMQVVNKREWNIPAAMYEQIGKDPFSFVRHGSFANSFMGSGKVKLYRDKDRRYVITADTRHTTRPNKPVTQEKTTGTHIFMMGDSLAKVIPFNDNDEFRSWYADGKLFRYNLSREASVLEIIDVQSGSTLAKEVLPGKTTSFPIYVRDGMNKVVAQENDYQAIPRISGRSNPSIYVSKSVDDKYLIMTGSKQVQDPGSIYAAAYFGLTGYIVYTITTGSRHAADSKGTDRYYYSSFDPSSSKLDRVPIGTSSTVRDDVDQYEMQNVLKGARTSHFALSAEERLRQLEGLPVTMLGYAENDDHVIAFYYNKHIEKVKVVWFPRN